MSYVSTDSALAIVDQKRHLQVCNLNFFSPPGLDSPPLPTFNLLVPWSEFYLPCGTSVATDLPIFSVNFPQRGAFCPTHRDFNLHTLTSWPRRPRRPRAKRGVRIPQSVYRENIRSLLAGFIFTMSKMWEVDPETRAKVSWDHFHGNQPRERKRKNLMGGLCYSSCSKSPRSMGTINVAIVVLQRLNGFVSSLSLPCQTKLIKSTGLS